MARNATPEEAAAAAQMERALQEEGVNTESQNVAGNDAPEPAPSIETPEAAAPKRKPGRPTDAERALRESLGSPSGEKASSTGGAKRGPKPKNKTSDPGTLAKSLVGIHALASMVTGIPEAQLSEPEGQALAEGVIAVCEEYGLNIDGKTGAAMQLFGACAMIYGPRVFAFKMRMAAQRQQEEQLRETNDNVHAFAPGYQSR